MTDGGNSQSTKVVAAADNALAHHLMTPAQQQERKLSAPSVIAIGANSSRKVKMTDQKEQKPKSNVVDKDVQATPTGEEQSLATN